MASTVWHVGPKGRCLNEELEGSKPQFNALCKDSFPPRGSERWYHWVLKDSAAPCGGNKEFQLAQILLWQLDRSSQMGDFRAALQIKKKKKILVYQAIFISSFLPNQTDRSLWSSAERQQIPKFALFWSWMKIFLHYRFCGVYSFVNQREKVQWGRQTSCLLNDIFLLSLLIISLTGSYLWCRYILPTS